MLWLWCRTVAAAPIGPLAWEPPYATDAAIKRKKKGIQYYQYLRALPPALITAPLPFPKMLAFLASDPMDCPGFPVNSTDWSCGGLVCYNPATLMVSRIWGSCVHCTDEKLRLRGHATCPGLMAQEWNSDSASELQWPKPVFLATIYVFFSDVSSKIPGLK